MPIEYESRAQIKQLLIIITNFGIRRPVTGEIVVVFTVTVSHRSLSP